MRKALLSLICCLALAGCGYRAPLHRSYIPQVTDTSRYAGIRPDYQELAALMEKDTELGLTRGNTVTMIKDGKENLDMLAEELGKARVSIYIEPYRFRLDSTGTYLADILRQRALDGVDVRLPRCAHGFFGADADAAVRMSEMCGRGGCELLADIGTNGEIALWRGDRHELTIASVAAGPAFERPGITGSQIIAALADALDGGVVDETGHVEGVLPGGLTQDDVRAVQLAKAAVKAGLDTLLVKSGVAYGDVARFSLAGGFGSGLDVAKAARIGLFAQALQSVAVICGNLAIEGAAAALFDPAFGDETDRIAHGARHVELGGDAEFADAFIEAIGFDESCGR